jgi:hypothetical protein
MSKKSLPLPNTSNTELIDNASLYISQLLRCGKTSYPVSLVIDKACLLGTSKIGLDCVHTIASSAGTVLDL